MSTFTTRIRPHVQREIAAAHWAEAWGRPFTARHHLARAHVLGQSSTLEHLRVHLAMGRLEIRERRWSAAWGQLWRTLAALVFTPLGLLPTGNPGGSDVSAFTRRAIPLDLQRLVDAARQ
jgi:hypothetical protein